MKLFGNCLHIPEIRTSSQIIFILVYLLRSTVHVHCLRLQDHSHRRNGGREPSEDPGCGAPLLVLRRAARGGDGGPQYSREGGDTGHTLLGLVDQVHTAGPSTKVMCICTVEYIEFLKLTFQHRHGCFFM